MAVQKKVYYIACGMLLAWLLLLLWTVAEMYADWRPLLIVGLIIDILGIASMVGVIIVRRKNAVKTGRDRVV